MQQCSGDGDEAIQVPATLDACFRQLSTSNLYHVRDLRGNL